MSLSTEQIALLQDAAKYAGLTVEWNLDYFFIPKPGPNNRRANDGGELWCPHEDSGDLYDLMAAGKVEFDWDNCNASIYLTEGPVYELHEFVREKFIKDDFTSQAWAVITVCAMAQRRLK